MKAVISILLTSLILLSGMHLSVATHVCGGEVAAVKLSFDSESASCGMENGQATCESQSTVASNCCQNQVSVFSVARDYASSFQVYNPIVKILQVFVAPATSSLYSFNPSTQLFTNVYPPGYHFASAVCLARICVFRI